MSIARFEKVIVNNLTFNKSAFGEQTTSEAAWFTSMAEVKNVANSVKISEKYRLYQDLVNFVFNYTPNWRTIVNNQNLYSLTYRGFNWRITDVLESNDRQKVTAMCWRNDPTTAI